MPPDNIRHSDEEPAAPARLVAALKAQHREPIAVPRRVDETILRLASEHLRVAASRRSKRGPIAAVKEKALVVLGWLAAKEFNWLKLAPWAAAAVALVAAAWLVHLAMGPPAPQNAEDVNHDGQVDMLDAFILARQVQQGDKPGARLDLNGDGVVDERDAEVLAARAVSLENEKIMKRMLAITLTAALPMFFSMAQGLAQQPDTVRFRTVDVFVDSSNKPLAVYQMEIVAAGGNAKIVGIEGGESAAFREPPVYDPKAIQHERVILGAFSTAAADKLPKGRTRVATLHVQTTGNETPQFIVSSSTAASSNGRKIPVRVVVEERK